MGLYVQLTETPRLHYCVSSLLKPTNHEEWQLFSPGIHNSSRVCSVKYLVIRTPCSVMGGCCQTLDDGLYLPFPGIQLVCPLAYLSSTCVAAFLVTSARQQESLGCMHVRSCFGYKLYGIWEERANSDEVVLVTAVNGGLLAALSLIARGNISK